MGRRCATVALAALALLTVARPARAAPAIVDLQLGPATGPPIDPHLVGFNWRAGGEAVAPLHPSIVRSFGVHLATVSPTPDVLDFAAADAELDAIDATGATPLVVLIERP